MCSANSKLPLAMHTHMPATCLPCHHPNNHDQSPHSPMQQSVVTGSHNIAPLTQATCCVRHCIHPNHHSKVAWLQWALGHTIVSERDITLCCCDGCSSIWWWWW